MKRFKYWLEECINLTEAKIEHFSHLGLDKDNPEHKDIVDAFNQSHQKLEKKNPNQYKTLSELKSAVSSKLGEIRQKRKEDAEDKEAFESGEAKLVHHDPKTGLKVYKVRSSKGCRAAGKEASGWCVNDKKTGDAAFQGYDPEGKHSYVIRTPEKGNLSHIGIIGVKPGQKHSTGHIGNFQDKGNKAVSDKDWEHMRKKYGLDGVKELHGIRGIHNEEAAKELEEKRKAHMKLVSNPDTDLHTLHKIATESDDPKVHKAIAEHQNAHESTLQHIAYESNYPEVHKAIAENPNTHSTTLGDLSYRSNDPEVHKAIAENPNTSSIALSHIAWMSNYTKVHKAILQHKNADDRVLRNVAERTNDPEIHKAIAQHKNAGYDTKEISRIRLSMRKSHMKKISNPNTSGMDLDEIAQETDDPEIYKAIAKHKNTYGHTLFHIAAHSNDPEVHKAIVNHNNVHDDHLSILTDKSNDPDLLKTIQKHPKASALTQIMAVDRLEHFDNRTN